MRKEKQLLLDEVKQQMEQRESFVIMRYLGLNATKTADFRRQVVDMGGELEVVKKRILIKAAQKVGLELDTKALKGHIGLVFGNQDALQITKAIFKLGKDTNQAVEVMGGFFEGKLYNASDVEKLSQLPGRDEMRAALLGTLEAPMAQTIAVMQSALCSVLYCLENKAKEESSN